MSVAPGAALPYQIKTPCRRQKLQATINTHHVQHQQQQQKLRSSKRYNATSPGHSTNNTAASKAHGKCIKLRSPLRGSFSNRQRPSSAKLQHYHRSIEQSSTTVDETIRAHIIDAARRIPSPPDLHSYAQCPTDHAPTSTKVMGNHRTSCILKK